MSNQVFSNNNDKYPIEVSDLPDNVVITDSSQTLTNKIITNLVSNGPISNFDTQKSLKIYNWQLATTTNAPVSIGFPITPGRPITVHTVASAVVTLGLLLDNSLSRQTSSLVNSITGSATWISDYSSISGNENAGTNAAVLQHLAAGTNITVAVTGVALNTILWRGVTYVYE